MRQIFFVIFLLTYAISLEASNLTQINEPIKDTVAVHNEVKKDILQKIASNDSLYNTVSIKNSPVVDSLIRLAMKQSDPTIYGYRIQIHAQNSMGVDLEKLKKMRDDFEISNPTIPAYLSYEDPDFKIRVGNFMTRLEAVAAYRKILKDYSSSYVVKCKLHLEELKRVPMQDVLSDSLQVETSPRLY